MSRYKYKYLTYKNKQIRFIETNKGNLFSIKNLVNVLWPFSCTYYQYVSLHNSLLIPIPDKSSNFRCTGLTGFREIVADKYDSFKDLEDLLISNNIIQGDLPAAETLRVIKNGPIIRKNIRSGVAMFSEDCIVSISSFNRYDFFVDNCNYAGGHKKKIDFISEDKKFVTMDRIFFHVNDILYLLKQDYEVDQYDFVYKYKDLTGTYKLLRDGTYYGECHRKAMFCNLNFFKQVIKDDYAVHMLDKIIAGTDPFAVTQNVIRLLSEQPEDTIKYHKYVKCGTSRKNKNNVSYDDVIRICNDIIAPLVKENKRLVASLQKISNVYNSLLKTLRINGPLNVAESTEI